MADVAVVGTSPVLLLEAAARARAGADVTVFTNGREFGGAWWVDTQAGFTNVETACHLLEADPVGYAVLSSIPGVELEPMTPSSSVHIGRGQSLRYGSPAATAAIAAIGLPAVARAGWRQSRESGPAAGARAARASASTRLEQGRNDLLARNQEILYPVGGAGALLASLFRLIQSEGVNLDDRRVDHIEADRRSAMLSIGGDQRSFADVVISAGYSGTIGGAPTDHTRRAGDLTTGATRQHDHLLLAVPTETLRPLSYERFMTDPILLRASDVTASAKGGPSSGGQSLLMLGTRRPADVDQVIGPLLHHGLLTEPVHPTHAVSYTHTSRDRADELLNVVADSAVTFVPTFGDLSRSLRGFSARHPSWLLARENHVSS